MKPSETFLLVILIAAFASCQTTKYYGLYTGAGYTFGYSFNMKPDNTFEYKLRGHMISDTSAGEYKMSGDTVYFTYRYDPHESETLPPPVPTKPRFAIWKKAKLYPFYSQEDKLNKRQVLKLKR